MVLSRRATVLSGLAALATTATPAPARDRDILKVAAARRGRLYGAAIEPEQLDSDGDYAALVARHCAVVAPENAMKWDALRPTRDAFDFRRADRMMAQAQALNVPAHGHCLVWHEALPAWFPKDPGPEEARALLLAHIAAVAGRYAGRMRSWDVVNEGVDLADRRPDGLRNSVWMRALGPDYFALSFRAAHEADPAARLALSDYGLEYDDIEWMADKRVKTLALLASLRAQGAPVHALALQGHLLGDRGPAFGRALRDFLRAVADLGLEIYVTELDVNDQHMTGDVAERDRKSADLYGAFLDVVLREPAVKMVNTWGISDRYNSKSEFYPRPDGAPVRPLPFDRDLQPKPATARMLAAFRA